MIPIVRPVGEIVVRLVAGAADAVVVYVSDDNPDVRRLLTAIGIPVNLNVGVVIATTRTRSKPDGRADFIDVVRSSEGQRILRRWSFDRVPPGQVT